MSEKIQFSIEVLGTDRVNVNLEAMNSNVDELTRSINANKEAMKSLAAKNQESGEEYKKLSLQTKLLTDEKKDLNKTLQQEIKTQLSAKNTMENVNAEVNKLRREIRFLDIGTEEYIATAQKIKTLEVLQRDHNEALGRGRTFVGEYAQGFEMATMNVLEMKKAIRDLRNESFAGKSQAEIKALNQQIGILEDSMKDLRAQQNAFGMEFGQALAGSLKFVAAGVEAVAGSMELLGLGEEEAQKAQRSLMALIAITHALGEIEDILQKKTLQVTASRIKDTAVTVKDTIAKWANVQATVAASGKTSFFGKAIAAIKSPLSLMLVGTAALVVGIIALADSLSKGSRYAAAFTETMNEGLKSSAKQRIELKMLGERIESLEEGTDEYRAAIDELNQKYGESIGYTLSYSASHKELAFAIDKATEAMIHKAQQEAILNKLTELYQTQIDKSAKNSTYFGDALDYTSQKILSTSSSLQNVNDEIAMFKDMLRSSSGLIDKSSGSWGFLNETFKESTDLIARLKAEQEGHFKFMGAIIGTPGKLKDVDKAATGAAKGVATLKAAFVDLKKEIDEIMNEQAPLTEEEMKQQTLLFLYNEQLKEEERLRILEEALNFELEIKDEYANNITEAEQKQYNDDIERYRKKEEAKAAIRKQFLDIAAQMEDNAATFVSNLKDTELINLETKLQQGLISEEEAAEKKKEINKKYAKAELMINISKIITDTAKAVMSVWAQFGAVPPLAIALSAFSVAAGASQVARARAEYKAVSSLGYGGTLQGNSHAAGGIKIGNNIEAEGGEMVINKRSSRLFAPVLSSINQYNGYGRPLKAAYGMALPPSSAVNSNSLGVNAGLLGIDMNEFAHIIVSGINDKQVFVTEKAISEKQNINNKIQARVTF